ncbi:hypothetical protein SAMN05421858_1879 [Haladaptatus litoreus]|uniref:Uncharacterized protein n=1 Tax=Haladaptatus litoreus TaxID=553468 RepID=A0A1N6Z5B4_9EURY|nr:hypothetical protein [Haladaptatus litoreus]SIR22030.1 hypothetical protein SAMN05421858_1879 [Haladaptatus litoreus]
MSSNGALSDETIRWSLDPTDSRLALVCLHGAYGIIGGVTLIVLLGIALVGVTTVLSGQFEILALALLLGLIGGPFSLLYLLPLVTESNQPVFLGFAEHLRPLPLVGSSIISAVALIGTVFVVSWLLLLFPAFYGAMLVVVRTFESSGELDPVRRVLTIDGTNFRPARELTFDDYDGFRRFELAGMTVFRLSSEAQRLSNKQWLTVPASVAPDVERVMEDGIGHEPTSQPTEVNRTVQATLVTFGLLLVGTAAGIVVVGRSAGQDVVVSLLLASMVGVFGFIFLYLAYDYRT